MYLIYFLFCVQVCSSYKILVVYPVPSRSHANLGNGIVDILLKAGHEVTYVTPFPIKEHPNLKQLDVGCTKVLYEGDIYNIQKFMRKELDFSDITVIHNFMANLVDVAFSDPNIRKWLDDPDVHYDVIIAERMFQNILSGLQTVFNCPFIYSHPTEPDFNILSYTDELPNPAYTPNVQSVAVTPFSFIERIHELWIMIRDKAKIELGNIQLEKRLYEKIFGPSVAKRGRQLPPYDVVIHNISLVLSNSHYSLGQAMRLPQNYVQIAGYHIDSNIPPLPENLQEFMDNAKHGVIYFSMGSILKSKDMPSEMKSGILKTFGQLKQRVIWKFEENLENRPENVFIMPWTPQKSILAHPNCVLFITHGGLLSTTESVHFGVPIIGIPVFIDQFSNIEKATTRGIAKRVDLTDNIAEELKNAITDIVEDPKYRQKVKELSFIYHHRPVSPRKELVHWVEHVVKTGGAPHLRSPALFVPWYQKMYLDLIASIIFVVYVIVSQIKRLCMDSKKVKRNKKSKTN